MPVILDTSALVRFFTNDLPQKATQVERLLNSEKDISIPDVVFPELEYVLSKGYKLPRTKIMEIYRFLVAQGNIKVSSYLRKSIEIFAITQLDMADCLVAAQAMTKRLASFDEKLLQVEGVTPFWK